jgi:4'-phosphopantetheinyl transferase EntD
MIGHDRQIQNTSDVTKFHSWYDIVMRGREGPERASRAFLAELLPPEVIVEESRTDQPESTLLPEERLFVANATESRRREFATVRDCARRALQRLGYAPVPILRTEHGAPKWPAGIVGSLTHCNGYRAAAVAAARQVVSLGIDAEPHEPLAPEVLEAITTTTERDWLRTMLPTEPPIHWDRLIFSAKESVYKTWFPLTVRWLDFSEVVIRPDPTTGTFTARVIATGLSADGKRLDHFPGRWLIKDGILATAIAISRQPPHLTDLETPTFSG